MNSPYRADKILAVFNQLVKDANLSEYVNDSDNHTPEYKTFYIPENENLRKKLKGIPKDTEMLVFPPCMEEEYSKWSYLLKLKVNKLTSLKELYLGHDGITSNNKTAYRKILESLPHLKTVYYCGYYSQIDYDKDICKEFPHITFEAIY